MERSKPEQELYARLRSFAADSQKTQNYHFDKAASGVVSENSNRTTQANKRPRVDSSAESLAAIAAAMKKTNLPQRPTNIISGEEFRR